MTELLKNRQFDSALLLVKAMKETWPSDAVFRAAAVTEDETSEDSSMSSDEDSACLVANLLGHLRHIFLGEKTVIYLCHGLCMLYLFAGSCDMISWEP